MVEAGRERHAGTPRYQRLAAAVANSKDLGRLAVQFLENDVIANGSSQQAHCQSTSAGDGVGSVHTRVLPRLNAVGHGRSCSYRDPAA